MSAREGERHALKHCLQERTSVDCSEGSLAVSIKILNMHSLWSSSLSSWYLPQGSTFTWVQRGIHCICWEQWNTGSTMLPIGREWLKDLGCLQTLASVKPAKRMWLICIHWHRLFYSVLKKKSKLWDMYSIILFMRQKKTYHNVHIKCLQVGNSFKKSRTHIHEGKGEQKLSFVLKNVWIEIAQTTFTLLFV